MGIAIIVHGGAWDIPLALHADHLAGCRAAAHVGWEILARGGRALDAIEAAIRVMEDHPVFDAGRGSHLNQDGVVELDAAIMEGKELALGAVGAVKRIANPISLARRVLSESKHAFLVGEGAERFAQRLDMPLCDGADLIVEREQVAWQAYKAGETETEIEFPSQSQDTVGAVALDAAGTLVAGNSTGGTMFKAPGRIGDTPIVGCGLYADNIMGAAACTGWGEQIMKTVLAKTAVDQIALLNNAPMAANAAIAYFQHRIGGRGGVICMAPDGQVGWAHSTPYMACAYRTSELPYTLATLRGGTIQT